MALQLGLLSQEQVEPGREGAGAGPGKLPSSGAFMPHKRPGAQLSGPCAPRDGSLESGDAKNSPASEVSGLKGHQPRTLSQSLDPPRSHPGLQTFPARLLLAR